MKIKEIHRTANVSWSPAKKYPTYLAAATAAQQLDATFSTSACLELYKLDVGNASKELELEAFINIDSRLNKLVWSTNDDLLNNEMPDLLIGGADEGKLFIWDPNLILKKEDPLKHLLTKHTGAVTSLDVNPFQVNLLASGAGDSEIFIWDLNSPENPMTPGSKIQPEADVTHLAWNRQVQHILASTHSGNCVVWDLRKNDPIIKIRDSMSRIKSNTICWHSDVATQLCVSSEDDHTPVIQVWDLRSATSPLKVLQVHNRGILSMSWSPEDANLLLSSAKDNRILCWNPNANNPADQLIYEMQTGTEWSYDVQWCPRYPNLFSGCSFDGHVSIYDVMAPSKQHASSRLADAFSAAESADKSCQATLPLCIAPKWMKRPCGASFAFGGKLVTFEGILGGVSEVRVSQVVTEDDLVTRATQLENAFETGDIAAFCDSKIEQLKKTDNGSELDIWEFLKVNSASDSQQKYLQLVGHEATKNAYDAFEESSMQEDIKSMSLDDPLPICTDDDKVGRITECMLVGDFESAVGACLHSGFEAEALILASVGSNGLLQKTQKCILNKNRSPLHMLISSIMSGDINAVVVRSEASNWKEVLTLILTYSPPNMLVPLCNLLGSKLEQSGEADLHSKAQLCYIVAGNVAKLVAAWRKEGVADSKHALQDLIEKVRILESSKSSRMSGLEDMACHLHQYAGILAEQGCTSTALNYLGNEHTDQLHLSLLKDRLYNSLSLHQRRCFDKPPATFQPTNIPIQQPPNRQPASNNGYNSQPNQQQQQPFNANNQQQLFNNQQQQPFNTNNQQQSFNRQPNNTQQQPSNMHSSNGPLSNHSQPPAKKNSFTSPAVPHVFNPLSAYDASTYQNNLYNQSPNSASSTPNYYQQQPQQPLQQQPPSVQQQSAYNNTTSLPTQPAPNNQQFKNYNIYNPTSYTPSQQASPLYPMNQQADLSSYQPSKPAKAWNDPPMLTSAKSKKNDAIRKQSFEGLLYNPQDYQQQPSYNLPPHHQQQQTTTTAAAAAAAAAEVVVKRERQVSERDQVIKDTFKRLAAQCLSNTSNPATRKKIDDVNKKLDLLYDLLADEKLSERVTGVLHQIVSFILSSDFPTALQSHSQLVNSGSFSEISSFGPSVKMLIQTALQLNAFIQ